MSLRAALLDGLMKVGLRNRERRQFYAMNILLETKGSDLTMLKARVACPFPAVIMAGIPFAIWETLLARSRDSTLRFSANVC